MYFLCFCEHMLLLLQLHWKYVFYWVRFTTKMLSLYKLFANKKAQKHSWKSQGKKVFSSFFCLSSVCLSLHTVVVVPSTIVPLDFSLCIPPLCSLSLSPPTQLLSWSLCLSLSVCQMHGVTAQQSAEHPDSSLASSRLTSSPSSTVFHSWSLCLCCVCAETWILVSFIVNSDSPSVLFGWRFIFILGCVTHTWYLYQLTGGTVKPAHIITSRSTPALFWLVWKFYLLVL